MNKTHSLITLITLLMLGACSGGGGGSTTPPQHNQAETGTDFSPDANRQLEAASDSTHLYVEQDFSFSAHRNVFLNVSLPDDDLRDASRTAIKVYDASNLDEEWSDSELNQLQLILQGFTDLNGYFQRALELPATTSHVLIETNDTGYSNRLRISTAGDTIHAQF